MSHVPLFIHDGKRHKSELRLDVKNSEEGRIKRSLWGQQGEHSKAGGVCFPAWCDLGEMGAGSKCTCILMDQFAGFCSKNFLQCFAFNEHFVFDSDDYRMCVGAFHFVHFEQLYEPL